MGNLPPNTFSRLYHYDVDFLEKPITDEEIRVSLFDMAPLKAPSSDRFHVLFFQKKWSIVGRVVCDLVKAIFDSGIIDSDLNNTFIVLIPKNSCPKILSQFRAISLYTVLYKLLMKVGFIAGRNITENIIITQEAIHSMQGRNKRKWKMIKIDLEKAYNQIRVFLNIDGIVSLGSGLAAAKGVVQNEMGTEFSSTIAIWGSVQLLTMNYGAFWMDSTSTISNSSLIRRIQYLLTEK
ncbi:hypothetical protein Gorai_017013, partial [Gossypium raimondii]|nr:hypothetical protein [Gossypium raimondii]